MVNSIISISNQRTIFIHIHTFEICSSKTNHYKQIGEVQLSLIRNFEHELKLLDYAKTNSHVINICTSSSGYELTLANSKKKIVDSSCSWNGFWKLIDKLF